MLAKFANQPGHDLIPFRDGHVLSIEQLFYRFGPCKHNDWITLTWRILRVILKSDRLEDRFFDVVSRIRSMPQVFQISLKDEQE